MFFIMFVLALCSVNSKGEILHSTLKASSVGCQSVMDDLEIWINGATQAATVTRIISKNFTTQTLTVNNDIKLSKGGSLITIIKNLEDRIDILENMIDGGAAQ